MALDGQWDWVTMRFGVSWITGTVTGFRALGLKGSLSLQHKKVMNWGGLCGTERFSDSSLREKSLELVSLRFFENFELVRTVRVIWMFRFVFCNESKKNTVRAFLFCYFSNQNEKITQRLQNNLTLLSDVKKLSNYIEMVSTKNDQIFAIKFCFFSSENFIWVFLLPFTACSTWVKLNLRNTEKQFNIRIFKDFFSIWDFLSLIWKLMESQPNQEPFCLGLSLTRLTLVSYKL